MELSNYGIVSEVNKDLESYFNDLNSFYSNFFELVKNRKCCPLVCQRFLNKFSLNKAKTVTYSYQTKKGILWVEWLVCKVTEKKLVAIGKDVTCVKKFEPIIKAQNRILKLQNKNMLDSLKYAQGIQKSLLPNVASLKKLSNNFIIYEPKDIVSGDFYWFHQKDDFLFIASIDCTGHGVPGALMTVLSNTLLNEIIIHQENTDPAQILKLLDEQLCKALKTNNRMIKDGLDIGLCRLDIISKNLTFSGAFQNVIVVKDKKINRIKGGRFPIGYYPYLTKVFKNQTLSLKKGNRFYLYSDGYQDQFGGENNKKIGTKKVISLIEKKQKLTLQQQKHFFKKYLKDWKAKEEQIDDILFMGFEI
ncbi:MAG: SpoIIE family protein phosphatase [Flavobacteriales bacterium]|nr:SpoIIE family protein phosphatase [Flavobacteriales bacterium]